MKIRLLNHLVCIDCKEKPKEKLKLEIFEKKDNEIFSGLLICRKCCNKYPIINFIPRMLPLQFRRDLIRAHPFFFHKYKNKFKDYAGNFRNIQLSKKELLKKKTLQSFSYQWTVFDKMHKEFEMNFLNYIYPIKKSFFKNKLGLDAGCGFGRHVYYAAEFGAEMIGMDLSEACEAAYSNTKKFNNAHIIQGDIYNPPFRENSFDFMYSIGVLHHLPMPRKGFETLLKFVKINGKTFIWVYSKKRRITNFFLEMFRAVTNKIPFHTLYLLCLFFAIFDWFFIYTYRQCAKKKIIKTIIDSFTFARIKLYAQYPFQVCFADWFDRLSAPIRFYYNRKDLIRWFTQNGLKDIIISPTGKYGWRAKGTK